MEAPLFERDFRRPQCICCFGRVDPDNLRRTQVHCGQRQRVWHVRRLDERDSALAGLPQDLLKQTKLSNAWMADKQFAHATEWPAA